MAGSFASTQEDPETLEPPPWPLEPHLFVVLHGDDPAAGAARHGLTNVDLVLIGRGRGSERAAQRDPARRLLELRLPGSFVSSRHARLVRQGEAWVLEDLGSRNGCLLRGERVQQAVLKDGDVLEIGHTLLRYREALPTPPAAPLDLDSRTLQPAAPGLLTLLPELAERLATLAPIARAPVPVRLLGETGTGKEVLARALHTLSGRPGAFVAVNCGGLPATLLESQLFGHKKGAFTGAQQDEPGYVRASDRGTLFLDEIGDLPGAAQAALLRVLQEREVVPVGSTRPLPVDLRVIAATHRPLDEMAGRGEFRGDLLGRLAGYRHELAPLRERLEDLGLLASALLGRPEVGGGVALRIAAAAARRLLDHEWPLNIRELHQCLAVARALAQRGQIELEHLPAAVREALPRRPEPPRLDADPAALREALVRLLHQHHGRVSDVARDLGKARTQVHRWLVRFGIDPNQYRPKRDPVG